MMPPIWDGMFKDPADYPDKVQFDLDKDLRCTVLDGALFLDKQGVRIGIGMTSLELECNLAIVKWILAARPTEDQLKSVAEFLEDNNGNS